MIEHNRTKLPTQLAVRVKKGWENRAQEFLNFCEEIRRDPPEVQRILMEMAVDYHKAKTPQEKQKIWDRTVQILYYESPT